MLLLCAKAHHSIRLASSCEQLQHTTISMQSFLSFMSFPFRRSGMLLFFIFLACVNYAVGRDLSLIRVDDASGGAVASGDTYLSSWVDSNTVSTIQTDGLSFAMDGCECTCDCPATHTSPSVGGKKCDCSCQCNDPSRKTTVEEKLLRDQEAIKNERRSAYERELSPQGSMVCATHCPGYVKHLRLWDAKYNTPIRIIKDGDVVCRPRRKVNFEAVMETACVESVMFKGSFGKHIENEELYFVYGDYLGDIFGKRLRVGRYVVRVRPFTGDNGTGIPGKEKVFRFRVVDCPRKRRLEEDDDGESGNDVQDAHTDDIPMIPYEYDFAMVGFPTGADSVLIHALNKHNETFVTPENLCGIESEDLSDGQAEESLDKALEHLMEISPSIDANKYSFYCPTALFDHHAISRIEKHSPNAKLVIGLVHPIFMLQHLFNHRVAEVYQSKLSVEIPPFETIVHSEEPWMDVSLASTRFEMFLVQLAKTPLSTEEMEILAEPSGYHLAIRPNKFTIFLYTYDPMRNGNRNDHTVFANELRPFLGLSTELPDSVLSDVAGPIYQESVSICDQKWTELRQKLLPTAIHTADWILKRFIKSRDVHVAEKDAFVKTLKSWNMDPCTPLVATS